MIRWLTSALAFLCCIGCNSKTETDATETTQQWFETDTLLVWNCDASTETKTRIFTPGDSVPIIQPFINGINQTWPEAKLKLVKIKTDTAVVTIQNTEWLNSTSGSSGAEQYVTFVALNLLETKKIHFVQFDIPKGTHAGPDTWSRNDFADWKTYESKKQ